MRNLLAVLLLGLGTSAHARITGTQPSSADIACWGPSGAEVCVDSDGNVIPTTASDTTVGTSALPFSNGFFDDLTLGDDLTVADDATIAGDLFRTMPSTTTVIDGSGLTMPGGACNNVVRLTATTDVQSSAANAIAGSASFAGCRVVLINSGGSGIIRFNASAGILDVGLGYPHTASIELGTSDVVEVMSIGTRWVVIGTVSDN